MNKQEIINSIYNIKALIWESPELSQNAIDEEILNLFDKILGYLEREEKQC